MPTGTIMSFEGIGPNMGTIWEDDTENLLWSFHYSSIVEYDEIQKMVGGRGKHVSFDIEDGHAVNVKLIPPDARA